MIRLWTVNLRLNSQFRLPVQNQTKTNKKCNCR